MYDNSDNSKKNNNKFDELSRFLLILSLIMCIVSLVLQQWILLIIAIVLVFAAYYRSHSKNISRRYNENRAYNDTMSTIKKNINDTKRRMSDRRTHLITKCPNCSQKIRLPKDMGRLKVKCPNCRIEFEKNTGKKKVGTR